MAQWRKESTGESDRYPDLHRVQEKKLYHDEKQADDPGQAGVQQVLPFLSETYPASGNQVAVRVAAAGGALAAPALEPADSAAWASCMRHRILTAAEGRQVDRI
jgi:hypothetical protein